jgi:outer membrane protein
MSHSSKLIRLIFLAALLFCLHVSFPFSVQAKADGSAIEVNFENLNTLLIERNSRVRAANLEKEAADSRKGSLGRSFLPRIEVHGVQETFKVDQSEWKSEPTFGAEIRSNLYNGGKDTVESEIRSVESERRAALRDQVVSEELQNVRKLFWEIVAGKERIELLEAMIKINAQNLASAERRIRSGVATESDRVEFEMKAVDLKRELAEVRLKQENASRQFAVSLGFELQTKLRLPEKMEHSHDFETLLKHEAKDHEFLFRDEILKGKKSELASTKERRVWLPKIEAFAAYNRFNEREEESGPGGPGRRDETVFGLRLMVETDDLVGSRREAAALKKEAAADFERAAFRRREIEAHMENEFSELRFLHDQVHDAEANIARAERYYKLTQSEYARGVKNSPDVLGASEKLFDSRLKRIELIREFQVAKAHLLAKLGR